MTDQIEDKICKSHNSLRNTYQALEGSHQEQEKNSPSSCSYEFEESVSDHFHQEGLSQLGPPSVLAYITEKVQFLAF